MLAARRKIPVVPPPVEADLLRLVQRTDQQANPDGQQLYLSKRDLDVAEVFDRGGDPLLRIITCGGTFRRSQRSYQDNVVVTALPR